MASKQSTVDFILDQLQGAGAVSARKMFGEYGVYLEGKMFALVCDDVLYFKPSAISAEFCPAAELAPPYPGAKPCIVIDSEQLEDRAWLGDFARATTRALPLPLKKSKKSATPG